jgi:hypothetical protein
MADESFCVRNRVNTVELENDLTLVRPRRFQLQFAPIAIFVKGIEAPTFFKTLGKIGVEFGRYFSPATLCLRDSRDSGELVAYSRISSV